MASSFIQLLPPRILLLHATDDQPNGEITPADAGEIGKLVEAYVKAFESAELAERLERLEKMTAQ